MIQATIQWSLDGDDFLGRRYSRSHRWEFDGGVCIQASSSPDIVPVPMSNPAAVDPEEAFLASVASCHMLWFLSVASGSGYALRGYSDHAVAEMGSSASGQQCIVRIELRPQVIWSGNSEPSHEEIGHLHAEAHRKCFIANSIRSEIVVHF
ncbi:MAG: OsmC family protein [Planctomycetota bacterium]